MNATQIMLDVEALIFSSESALPLDKITEFVGNVYEEIMEPDTIQQALDAIVEKYSSEHYPFEVKKIGGGYQFLTKSSYHKTISQINGDKFNKKLSATAMETLAIIAYRQPITKTEIEHIRGVSSDYAIHKLLEKELIVIAGRDEASIGKPIIYGTSKDFFDFLGINDKGGLPELKELNTELLVVPTEAIEAMPESDTEIDIAAVGNMSVDDDGNLLEELNNDN